jgi:catechol 2,3-dioxygenase-like lactoylglutathione lyase family enzyme
VPIDHVKLPVSDLEASRAFYSVALAPFGYKLVYDGDESLGFGAGDGGDDDEPFALQLEREPPVRTHVAFTAMSPDGHNIEAVYHGPDVDRRD